MYHTQIYDEIRDTIEITDVDDHMLAHEYALHIVKRMILTQLACRIEIVHRARKQRL